MNSPDKIRRGHRGNPTVCGLIHEAEHLKHGDLEEDATIETHSHSQKTGVIVEGDTKKAYIRGEVRKA